MTQQKIKFPKTSNKLAQIMYSCFSLDEIYNAAALGMSMDAQCKNKTGIPVEITEEYFNCKILDMDSPNKDKILSFQKKRNELIKKQGVHYDVFEGMTETERYAYIYFISTWYKN